MTGIEFMYWSIGAFFTMITTIGIFALIKAIKEGEV